VSALVSFPCFSFFVFDVVEGVIDGERGFE